ncbi:MAG: adenylyltransferase/cytidyltransferase family protein, partial [Sediminibacterium sp.]
MKVHYDLTTLPQFKDAIVTMGAFDGVHKGHQQIIQRMKQLAQ